MILPESWIRKYPYFHKMEKASKENNWHYNPKLTARAKNLRRDFTKAESYLWKFALKRKLTGYTFNIQPPVLLYIADFLCRELLLIIECDGATHLLAGAKKKTS